MDIRERDCATANGDHRIAMTVINGGDRRRKLCGCLLYQRVYAVRPQTRCALSKMDNKKWPACDAGHIGTAG